jgi:hypothetical protein
MKFSLIVLLTVFSAMASAADTTVLGCSTGGFALSEVNLVQKADGSSVIAVRRSEADDAPVVSYTIRSSLSNIVKGDADTLVGVGRGSVRAGGAQTKSVLLRVSPGQKKAFLAMGGDVYDLNCY